MVINKCHFLIFERASITVSIYLIYACARDGFFMKLLNFEHRLNGIKKGCLTFTYAGGKSRIDSNTNQIAINIEIHFYDIEPFYERQA